MHILAIETSCDDTSMAIMEIKESKKRGEPPVFNVLKSVVSSQTKIHRHWGGVVPNLAKREHLKNLPLIWRRMSEDRGPKSDKWISRTSDIGHRTLNISPPPSVDFIAVTVGPGLEPSLWTGIEFAKKLSQKLNVPLVGANHLEGHLYSNFLPPLEGEDKGGGSSLVASGYTLIPSFPAITLLVSGGHTMLILMKSLHSWKKLGETRDDAVGEAFDKVAKMLGLPYPGGPEIEKLAAKGNPEAIKFPRPMIREKNYEFSFSGLKTAALYYLRDIANIRRQMTDNRSRSVPHPPSSVIADISASFQAAAIDVLAAKTKKAALEFGVKSIFLCGGVAANRALRVALQKSANEIGAKFFAPAPEYNTDNAAMIAAAAYMRVKSRKKTYPIEADSNLTL